MSPALRHCSDSKLKLMFYHKKAKPAGPASRVSCFIVFIEALPQTSNKKALNKLMTSEAAPTTSDHCNLDWGLSCRDP